MRVVRARYPEIDFPTIRLRPELDHDGDPVLAVEIYFRPEDEELRCRMGLAVELIGDMQDRLWAIGRNPFPASGVSSRGRCPGLTGLRAAELLAAARVLLEASRDGQDSA